MSDVVREEGERNFAKNLLRASLINRLVIYCFVSSRYRISLQLFFLFAYDFRVKQLPEVRAFDMILLDMD